jgi:hypothetical protein
MGFLASDARKSRGFLHGSDPPDRVDVVTGVAADPGGRCRYEVTMSFDLEDGLDPAELWAEKQRSRDEDRRALESGEKTIEQLREENGVFAQLAPISRVNLSASRSLGWVMAALPPLRSHEVVRVLQTSAPVTEDPSVVLVCGQDDARERAGNSCLKRGVVTLGDHIDAIVATCARLGSGSSSGRWARLYEPSSAANKCVWPFAVAL